MRTVWNEGKWDALVHIQYHFRSSNNNYDNEIYLKRTQNFIQHVFKAWKCQRSFHRENIKRKRKPKPKVIKWFKTHILKLFSIEKTWQRCWFACFKSDDYDVEASSTSEKVWRYSMAVSLDGRPISNTRRTCTFMKFWPINNFQALAKLFE